MRALTIFLFGCLVLLAAMQAPQPVRAGAPCDPTVRTC